MNQLFIKGKIKSTLFVILMLSVSILSGCVSDDGTIIVGDENENNDGGNETVNNTDNETVNNTDNETANNTDNETANNTGNETANNTGNETANNTSNNPLSLAEQCLSGHDNLAMHIHPLLKLTVRGTEIPIPENMGIDTFACPNAMHLLHTHDNTGKLHIETYEPITLNLSLFFAVWNISHPGDSTFDPLFLDLDNVTITMDGVEQTVGINEVIFEDGISIHVIFDDSDNDSFADSDGDGYNDSVEFDCQSDYQDFNSIPQDTDGDGICDPLDPVNDLITMWENNSAHFLYVKPDIIANSNTENAKPYQIEFSANPMAEQNPVVLTQICDKGQGHVADVWSAFVLGPFPYDIISWHVYNTNGISIGMFVSRDNLTQSDNMTFPTVISTQDTENQSSGHLEAVVTDSQYYTCEFDYTDTDGDGVLDWMDAFPNDECAITDTDGDGMPDNILDGANDPVPNCQTNLIEDDDDDDDTCADYMDWAPLNSTECFDTDGDGIGDSVDTKPWINNDGNGTFTMNYTMIGIKTGHNLYWLGQNYHAYHYSTSPDMVWNDGPRAPVYSYDNLPNVDVILTLMGLTKDDLGVSTYPIDLGTDTEDVEWGYDDTTHIEWRALSSNLSIFYVDGIPLFSINASLMLYLDYTTTISSWGVDPVTMWGNSSFSPITSMLTANHPLIYHHLFNAYFEDFGGNYINYSFTSQDAIITTDYNFDNTDNNLTGWLTSLVVTEGNIVGGLFDSVVSEVNVESSQNGITMTNSVNNSMKLAIFSERDEKDSEEIA
jgi:hypothetical protein